MQYLVGLLVVGFVFVSVMMMLVVLIQRPTGGGLSGAFGAASEGAGQTAFGARTGDALTTATIVIFLLFLGFAIGLNYLVQAPTATKPAAEAVPSTTDTSAGTTPAAPAGAPPQQTAPAQTPPAESKPLQTPPAQEPASTPAGGQTNPATTPPTSGGSSTENPGGG